MHIVLGVLGAVVTILILLNRLQENGLDVGWLDPFAWRRRREWRRRYTGNPIYAIEQPLDAAALLMLSVAKRDGDLASAEKDLPGLSKPMERSKLLELYRDEFRMSEREAAALLASSAHLLGAGDAFTFNLEKVLAPSKEAFSDEQVTSTLALMERIAEVGGAPSALQRELIEDVRSVLAKGESPEGTWA